MIMKRKLFLAGIIILFILIAVFVIRCFANGDIFKKSKSLIDYAGDFELFEIPPHANPSAIDYNNSSVQRSYEKGYRDSLEYTRLIDSSFAKRIHNLSEEENEELYVHLISANHFAFADDIIAMAVYDDCEINNRFIIILQVESGDLAAFEIAVPTYEWLD